MFTKIKLIDHFKIRLELTNAVVFTYFLEINASTVKFRDYEGVHQWRFDINSEYQGNFEIL